MELILSFASIAILIASVVVHEFAHAWTADKLGDKTARYAGRLTLNPVAHLDPVGSFLVPLIMVLTTGIGFGWAKPVPYNPYNIRHKYGDTLVALAGPVSNLILAFLAALISLSSNSTLAFIGQSALIINVALMLFNLIPVPPLDGSKIISPLLPYSVRHRFLMPGPEQIVFVGIVLLVIWPILSPAVSTVATFFLKIAGSLIG